MSRPTGTLLSMSQWGLVVQTASGKTSSIIAHTQKCQYIAMYIAKFVPHVSTANIEVVAEPELPQPHFKSAVSLDLSQQSIKYFKYK